MGVRHYARISKRDLNQFGLKGGSKPNLQTVT